MQIEVDQSGKVEHTKINTVLAFSNSEASAVLIPAVEKRVCLKELRKRGLRGFQPYLSIFAAGVFVLIRDHVSAISRITIDIENPGHERAVRRLLLVHIRKVRSDFPPDAIVFARVGKKSRAHIMALAVFRQQGRHRWLPPTPARCLRARELLWLIG